MTLSTDILNHGHESLSGQSIRPLYTSACVNRHSGCMSILPNRTHPDDSTALLAFGSSHAVCLANVVRALHGTDDEHAFRQSVPMFHVFHVLLGHDAPVIAVRWIPIPNMASAEYEHCPYRFLASLDSSGKVLLWSCHVISLVPDAVSQNHSNWFKVLELQLPEACNPNAIDGCILPSGTSLHPDLIRLMINVVADTVLCSWYIKIKITTDGLSNIFTSDPLIVQRKHTMCHCVRSMCWPLSAHQSPAHQSSSLCMVFVGLDNGNIEVWSEHVPGTPSTVEPRQLVHSATLFGHTDWVRCLDLCFRLTGSTPVAFLVSGAQDHVIRLWRLYCPDGQCSHSKEDRSTLKVAELHLPDHVELKLCIASESVLSSHDNWITGVAWETSTGECVSFPPALLSCSMDRSMILWAPPSQPQTVHSGDEPNLWLEQIRVGDIGGTGLGFLGCDWLPATVNGRAIIGHNFLVMLVCYSPCVLI
ncbi:unnamed protein product [Echinostoma caproni]|uniref:Elongator complex protein 2 n=1 Tax=Echinostoma caproni TaxID=27848 RepID=A0A183A171_9TREM|nr:unnamed protein product [Echinostoma caproni]